MLRKGFLMDEINLNKDENIGNEHSTEVLSDSENNQQSADSSVDSPEIVEENNTESNIQQDNTTDYMKKYGPIPTVDRTSEPIPHQPNPARPQMGVNGEKPNMPTRMDVKNPFFNRTENRDFYEDYREIVPVAGEEGVILPVVPHPVEKRKIRMFYNRTGAVILSSLILTNILAVVLMTGIQLVMQILNPEASAESIGVYISESSSIFMSINLIIFLITNLLLFFIGCKVTKIDTSSLFRKPSIKIPKLLMYIGIALLLQMVAGFVSLGFNFAYETIFDKPMYTPDFDVMGSWKITLVTVLYSCIIAPITEEMVFRGFVLKNLSRANQWFGITASAFFFALWHQNIPQGILAFLTGILLGYVTIKYNSIFPAIIIHMSVNTVSTLLSFTAELNEIVAGLASMMWLLVVGVGGMISVVMFFVFDKLPKPNIAQKTRGAAIAVTSCTMIITTIALVGLTIFALVTM